MDSIFDQVHERRNTDSQKWQKYAGHDILPMWVADMDFKAPEPVLQALHDRIDHGIFGYACPERGTIEAVIEMLQHKCDRIRVTSSLFLDVIMDVDEQQMDKQIQMGNANAVRGYTQAGYSLRWRPLCSSCAAIGGTVGAADSNAQVRVVQRGVDEGDRGRCAAGGLL